MITKKSDPKMIILKSARNDSGVVETPEADAQAVVSIVPAHISSIYAPSLSVQSNHEALHDLAATEALLRGPCFTSDWETVSQFSSNDLLKALPLKLYQNNIDILAFCDPYRALRRQREAASLKVAELRVELGECMSKASESATNAARELETMRALVQKMVDNSEAHFAMEKTKVEELSRELEKLQVEKENLQVENLSLREEAHQREWTLAQTLETMEAEKKKV